MVTSFGCSCVDGLGAGQSPSHWRSFKVRGKIEEGGIDDKGIVMEVEGAWNVGGMGMLSCMRVGLLPVPPLLFEREFTISNLKSRSSWETIAKRRSGSLFCCSIGPLNVSDKIHL